MEIFNKFIISTSFMSLYISGIKKETAVSAAYREFWHQRMEEVRLRFINSRIDNSRIDNSPHLLTDKDMDALIDLKIAR